MRPWRAGLLTTNALFSRHVNEMLKTLREGVKSKGDFSEENFDNIVSKCQQQPWLRFSNLINPLSHQLERVREQTEKEYQEEQLHGKKPKVTVHLSQSPLPHRC